MPVKRLAKRLSERQVVQPNTRLCPQTRQFLRTSAASGASAIKGKAPQLLARQPVVAMPVIAAAPLAPPLAAGPAS